jgi:hypothetical protein
MGQDSTDQFSILQDFAFAGQATWSRFGLFHSDLLRNRHTSIIIHMLRSLCPYTPSLCTMSTILCSSDVGTVM